MKRYILTGTPGAGKTAVLRQLEREGFAVVEEAATDVIALEQAKGIAQPWTIPSFIAQIVDLQRRRLERHATAEGIQFHDRSAVCTAALADWLGYPRPAALVSELERLEQESVSSRAYSLCVAWASSNQPRRARSATKMPNSSSRCTKKPIGSGVLRSCPSSRQACWIVWRRFGGRSGPAPTRNPYPRSVSRVEGVLK